MKRELLEDNVDVVLRKPVVEFLSDRLADDLHCLCVAVHFGEQSDETSPDVSFAPPRLEQDGERAPSPRPACRGSGSVAQAMSQVPAPTTPGVWTAAK